MIYSSLRQTIDDLEKNGHLIRIKEEVDPELEMAAIHLRVFEKKGPAILFEKIKGCRYQAVSNLFGNLERSRFMFGEQLNKMKKLVQLRNDPMQAIKRPFHHVAPVLSAMRAVPRKGSFDASGFEEIRITDLPLIKHWPMDGGAFVTLPQVYTEDIEKPGVMNSNLGMYRIQLNGNDYVTDQEIGLHYQIHRGIGVHQEKSNSRNVPLRVSIFVGGPPSHTLAAVMPLPEGVSELTFAGALAGKRFRYAYKDGFCISLDADFVITGEVQPFQNKPEGPFGDHFGYYSLVHPFPVMKVHKVYAKKNAIWPFTVVGRPPQEDTAFGALIHEISGTAIPHEIPGVKEIHAVDAAGVHPLLLAVGSERYTPYLDSERPAELLTQASRILGTGQLSLAKYLVIAAGKEPNLNCHNVSDFLKYAFERIDFGRDLHFITRTTIDTLDYSGNSINEGSKLIMAATGRKIRDLSTSVPSVFNASSLFMNPVLMLDGVIALQYKPYTTAENAKKEMAELCSWLSANATDIKGLAQIIVHDKFEFKNLLNDYLWITYTRSNPSHDVYGPGEKTENKHWSCDNPMIIDARIKPHHAPALEIKPETLKAIERFFVKGASLEKW